MGEQAYDVVATVLIVVIAGGAGIHMVLLPRFRHNRLLTRSVPTSAVVLGTRQAIFAPPGLNYAAQVGFRTPDGRPVTAWVRLWGTWRGPRVAPGWPVIRVGQTIPVAYDPTDPRRAEVGVPVAGGGSGRSRAAEWIMLGALGVLVPLVVLAAVAFTAR